VTHLEAGDAAPAFTAPTSTGRSASLAEFSGRPLALFFYPKDDTETCTKEALSFSEKQSKFRRRGIGLLGVSPDSVADHRKFVTKYGLKLRLVADEDRTICSAYGVWGEKQLYGRKYMGVIRTTFLIGPDGVIRNVWTVTRVAGHAEDVLEAATAAASGS
jgi:peroxiredoxin Q/BCP